jgi:hypothetical protein
MRTPLETGYLYARDHVSSRISFTSPYVDSASRIARSSTSGGKFAIRTRLVPMPASSICAMEISPFS